METIIVGGVGFAWVWLGVTLYQNLRLLRIFWREREARILLLSHVTLKAWAFVYTLIVLWSVLVDGFPAPVRVVLSLLLVLLLDAQAFGAFLAHHRWRDRQGYTLAEIVRKLRQRERE